MWLPRLAARFVHIIPMASSGGSFLGGHRSLHTPGGAPGVYPGLPWATRGLSGVTRGLPGVTQGYSVSQPMASSGGSFLGGNRSLQDVSSSYRKSFASYIRTFYPHGLLWRKSFLGVKRSLHTPGGAPAVYPGLPGVTQGLFRVTRGLPVVTLGYSVSQPGH